MENEAHIILTQAHAGQYQALQTFLNDNPQYHWSDVKYPKTGDTPLHIAARLGHLPLLEYLLQDSTPGVDCKNNDDKTALHEAAQFHQTEAVIMLIEKGSQINALKRGDWTPLMLACTKPFPDIVHILLDKGASVSITNRDGWAPIHLACRTGCLLVVKKLLDYKADVGKITKNGRNCLHIACLHGHIEIVRLLLKCRNSKRKRILDVNSKDVCGNTPLHEAVLGRNIEICQVLLDHGAEKESTNKVRFSLLHLAASGEEDLKMLRYLVEKVGLDVNNLSSPQGLSPLHCAARNKRRTTYETLLQLGAKEEIKDSFGRTAKDYFK